jgi:hypothetical protein
LFIGWTCNGWVAATTIGPVGPVVLPAYTQCNGFANAVCAAGTACFRNNANYSECRPYCPATWACETDVATTIAPVVGPVVLPAYTQCNGLANTVCAVGNGCFRSNANYSECRPYCPATWACETDVAGVGEQCGGLIFAKLSILILYFVLFL